MNKLDVKQLKQEACQKEMLSIVGEFRNVLLKHFDAVTFNSRKLINERWEKDAE